MGRLWRGLPVGGVASPGPGHGTEARLLEITRGVHGEERGTCPERCGQLVGDVNEQKRGDVCAELNRWAVIRMWVDAGEDGIN